MENKKAIDYFNSLPTIGKYSEVEDSVTDLSIEKLANAISGNNKTVKNINAKVKTYDPSISWKAYDTKTNNVEYYKLLTKSTNNGRRYLVTKNIFQFDNVYSDGVSTLAKPIESYSSGWKDADSNKNTQIGRWEEYLKKELDIRFDNGGSITSKGTFKSLGTAKELGITPKISEHDMIAKCDCGEKFSYQNSKKNILWQCPECNGMKRIDENKMADGGTIDELEKFHYEKYLEFKNKAEELLNSNEMPSKYENPKKGTRSYEIGKRQMELGDEAQKHFSMYLKLKREREKK